MSNGKRLYSELFQQKSMLEKMRIYLELHEEFLDELKRKKIISGGDLDFIKKLPWPASRTELLQLLVKKTWSDGELEIFVDIIHKTQKPQLSEIVKEKLKIPEQNGLDSTSSFGASISGISKTYARSELDEMLSSLSIINQNRIKIMLRDRDEEISSLALQNKKLVAELDRKSVSMHTTFRQHDSLEKKVTDWLAGLRLKYSEGAGDDLASSLADVERNIEKLEERESFLEEEKTNLERNVECLTAKIDYLEHKTVAELENKIKRLQDETIWSLKSKIKSLENENKDLKRAKSENERIIEDLKSLPNPVIEIEKVETEEPHKPVVKKSGSVRTISAKKGNGEDKRRHSDASPRLVDRRILQSFPSTPTTPRRQIPEYVLQRRQSTPAAPERQISERAVLRRKSINIIYEQPNC